jgi:hypothetical protein
LIEQRIKTYKDETPDVTLNKYCIFAVGDTFGNVGLFKETVSEAGTKSDPLFVYRNTESAYSIESLSYDPTGKLLIASTTKNFVILFYLDTLEFFDKKVRQVNPTEYFKQNHLISNQQQALGKLQYKNLGNQIQKPVVKKTVVQPINKMNKPVFYRKGSKPKQSVQVKTTPTVATISNPQFSSSSAKFMLKNEKTSFLKEKKETQFISVINLLKPIMPLSMNKQMTFDEGCLLYSLYSVDGHGTQMQSNRIPLQVPGLSLTQGNSSGFFDFNTTRSELKMILTNKENVQWQKKFSGMLLALEVNSKFVVFLNAESKLSVVRISSGRKALFSIEAFNLFTISLSKSNSLLLVRRNGFFSVIDLETQKMKFSGNCFELLKQNHSDPDTLLSNQEVRFLLGDDDTIFFKIFHSVYIYNYNLELWQSVSNCIFYSAFEQQPQKIQEFDLPNFPNDPGEIFDNTPFSFIQAGSDIFQRYFTRLC